MKLKARPEKQFVIKRVPYVSANDKKTADEELKMLKKVQSIHTVRFIESFPDGIDLCIVMEYCTGGNLRGLITEMKNMIERDKKIV